MPQETQGTGTTPHSSQSQDKCSWEVRPDGEKHGHMRTFSHEPIFKLIRKKALTQCNLNGLDVSALLERGAQVSMIDWAWKDKNLPDVDVRPLAELIGSADRLEVCAVNGDIIPFDGWTVITVNLPGNDDPNMSIPVPFLVSRLQIERPLLGFNVIEELIQGQSVFWCNFCSQWVRRSNESTRYSPFYLLYGRHPHLPVDLIYGLVEKSDPVESQWFAVQWAKRMTEAHRIAHENSKQSSAWGKAHYDLKVKGVMLKPGDRVLVRNLSKWGGQPSNLVVLDTTPLNKSCIISLS